MQSSSTIESHVKEFTFDELRASPNRVLWTLIDDDRWYIRFNQQECPLVKDIARLAVTVNKQSCPGLNSNDRDAGKTLQDFLKLQNFTDKEIALLSKHYGQPILGFLVNVVVDGLKDKFVLSNPIKMNANIRKVNNVIYIDAECSDFPIQESYIIKLPSGQTAEDFINHPPLKGTLRARYRLTENGFILDKLTTCNDNHVLANCIMGHKNVGYIAKDTPIASSSKPTKPSPKFNLFSSSTLSITESQQTMIKNLIVSYIEKLTRHFDLRSSIFSCIRNSLEKTIGHLTLLGYRPYDPLANTQSNEIYAAAVTLASIYAGRDNAASHYVWKSLGDDTTTLSKQLKNVVRTIYHQAYEERLRLKQTESHTTSISNDNSINSAPSGIAP